MSSQAKRRRTWKKTVSFICNQKRRQRFDTDNVRQLRAKVSEWHAKTKAPIACFVYVNGRVNFITTPGLRGLAKHAELQKLISDSICDNTMEHAGDDTVMGNMTIDIPQDYKGRNVHYLRDIVMDIVTSKGKRNAYWGTEAQKPFWWPTTVKFVSPKNNRSTDRPKRDDLLRIIQSFVDSRGGAATADHTEVGETDEEDERDEDDREEDDRGEVLKDEDIESLCDMVDTEMTLVDCQTIMCNLASLIWPSLERASTMIATTAYDACQSAIPRGRNPVQERHIRIWSRHAMPEKATGYEPVDITSDANSLTRSASRMLYHTEKLWPLIRVGMLSKAISERDYHVNQISNGVVQFHADMDPLEQFKDGMYNSMLALKSEDNQFDVKSSKFEASCLSRFLDMDVKIIFTGNTEICFYDTEHKHSLLLISDESYQVMPLVRLENEIELDNRRRCDARSRCLVSSTLREEQSLRCKNCLWTYHPSCVGNNDSSDDCGCKMIPEVGSRLNAFKNLSTFSALFDQYETELQALVEGLFCGTIQSCRNLKSGRMRNDLNCFVGGLSFEIDHHVIDRVGDWMDQQVIETPLDDRRKEDFFCDVAIREVEMFLIMKETKVGRLTAERAARKYLSPNYPTSDMWLHMSM